MRSIDGIIKGRKNNSEFEVSEELFGIQVFLFVHP